MSKLVHPVKSASANAAAQTATGQGSAVDLRAAGEVVAVLNVLAMAGSASPTLTAKVQYSVDGSTNWTDVPGGAFTAVTAVPARQVIGIPNGPATNSYLRAAWTISGTTPSFTFAVDLIGLRLKDSGLEDAI